MRYKKYIVFGFNNFYAIGGLEDIIGDFDDFEDAKKCETNSNRDCTEIIDRDTWEEVSIEKGERHV